MTRFSDRFNKWLIEHGKDPIDPIAADHLDAAAAATARALGRDKDILIDEMKEIAARHLAGDSVDVEERAKELVIRLEERA